jgi:GT2 family glycosyltransferase
MLSIVIPTRDRHETVRRRVEQLARMARDEVGVRAEDLEILVVDDGSVRPVELCSDECRVIRLERSRGRGAARNVGARLARGHYLAFVDDDTYSLPGTGISLLRLLEIHEDAWISPVITSPSWTPPREPELLTLEAIASAFLITRRVTFESVGGFDEHLDSLEDYELSLRARQAGHRLLMFTGVAAVHDDPRSSFPIDAVRSHDWIYATPSVWARTGGKNRPLTAWEVQTYAPALLPRYRAVALLAQALQPAWAWRLFVQSLRITPPSGLLVRALHALARARGARAGLREIPREHREGLRSACRLAANEPPPERVIQRERIERVGLMRTRLPGEVER